MEVWTWASTKPDRDYFIPFDGDCAVLNHANALSSHSEDVTIFD
jgi:hypothetical protein